MTLFQPPGSASCFMSQDATSQHNRVASPICTAHVSTIPCLTNGLYLEFGLVDESRVEQEQLAACQHYSPVDLLDILEPALARPSTALDAGDGPRAPPDHHIVPLAQLADLATAFEPFSILVEESTLNAHAVQNRDTSRKRLREYVAERGDVEREQEAETAHREAEHGRALALPEQRGGVQNRAVAAERQDEVRVWEQFVGCRPLVCALAPPRSTEPTNNDYVKVGMVADRVPLD
ncbi:hypothetical protein A1Q2_04285 [Trichosporon asahii var. asahii CBS 8904]|uniref:Uncharacterized protein n=1 Tax=Trichosporon asahii var. asahii (strain CBS 8904) TaxID=1220162 RepID=K1VX72_TRIAC|nr:hypothetical protein A1Q2_04285 [Trichosporon asahii var. asahii CBS 8904]